MALSPLIKTSMWLSIAFRIIFKLFPMAEEGPTWDISLWYCLLQHSCYSPRASHMLFLSVSSTQFSSFFLEEWLCIFSSFWLWCLSSNFWWNWLLSFISSLSLIAVSKIVSFSSYSGAHNFAYCRYRTYHKFHLWGQYPCLYHSTYLLFILNVPKVTRNVLLPN